MLGSCRTRDQLNLLIKYYEALRNRQTEIWRSKNQTFHILTLTAGALAYFLSTGSDTLLKTIGALTLPAIFAFLFLELMSAWYEDRFVVRELLRIEGKINRLCGNTILQLDANWHKNHKEWSRNYVLNPTYTRGIIFLVWVGVLFLISSIWTITFLTNIALQILAILIDIILVFAMGTAAYLALRVYD